MRFFTKKLEDNSTSEKVKNYLLLTLKTAPKSATVKKFDTYDLVVDNNCFLIEVDATYRKHFYNNFFTLRLNLSIFDVGEHFKII